MLKHELQSIISGKSETSSGNLIQTVTCFLRTSKESGVEAKEGKLAAKEQETKKLISFIDKEDLWYKKDIIEDNKIGEGAEQKVYLNDDHLSVIKFNDTVFYLSWLDYFHNLLLHNYFFPDTKYELIGFKYTEGILYAVVKQYFIRSTEVVNLLHVKEFLSKNGFINKKNNDYYNNDLGIILEDLHDENVLVNDKILFFIDTVFYLTKTFYE